MSRPGRRPFKYKQRVPYAWIPEKMLVGAIFLAATFAGVGVLHLVQWIAGLLGA